MDYLKVSFQDNSYILIKNPDDIKHLEDNINIADWVYLSDEKCYINLHKVTFIMREEIR